MIELIDLKKIYHTRSGDHVVLNGLNLCVNKGEKIGILGRNGAGKSTLIRILSGAERPTSGQIIRGMNISWPLAFGGAFQSSLSGLDNLKFICRIYGLNYKDKLAYVEEFCELGKYIKEPVKSYSFGMRARLAFAISMAIDFDFYLIDEIISVGDSRFHTKCNHELFEKKQDKGFFLVSHEAHNIREHCEKIYVLSDGKVLKFESMDTAYEWYQLN